MSGLGAALFLAALVAPPAASNAQGAVPAARDELRRGMYRAVLEQLHERHLHPHLSELGVWGGYSARPARGGVYRAVSFHREHSKPDGSRRRFYVRRLEYTGRDVSAALDHSIRATDAKLDAGAIADRVGVERSRADDETCPSLKRAFAELERLPPPRLAVLGLDDREPEAVSVVGDGVSVTLSLSGIGIHERAPAAAYGEVTFSNNTGPAHDCVMRFERDVASCWRPDSSR